MKRPIYLSVYEWDQMTDEERRQELLSLEQDDPALLGLSRKPAPPVRTAPIRPAPRRKRESRKPAPPVAVIPRTIREAFVLVEGRLMRRRVARVEVVQRNGERFTREVEHLAQCGNRVRFGGRVYSAAVVAHYLQTGELVERVPRAKTAPRFKAQVREGARVRHLGYFATAEERDAAVFAYRIGVFPSGSKNA